MAACGDVTVVVSGGRSGAQVEVSWVALRQTPSLYHGSMSVDPNLPAAVRQAVLKHKSTAASARMPATEQPVLVRNPDETFHWAGGGEVAKRPAPTWETPAERLRRTGNFWPDNAADAGMFVAGLAAAPVVAMAGVAAAPFVLPAMAVRLAQRQVGLWQEHGWREGTTQFLGEQWQSLKDPFDLAKANSPFDMGLRTGNWLLLAYSRGGPTGGEPPDGVPGEESTALGQTGFRGLMTRGVVDKYDAWWSRHLVTVSKRGKPDRPPHYGEPYSVLDRYLSVGDRHLLRDTTYYDARGWSARVDHLFDRAGHAPHAQMIIRDKRLHAGLTNPHLSDWHFPLDTPMWPGLREAYLAWHSSQEGVLPAFRKVPERWDYGF